MARSQKWELVLKKVDDLIATSNAALFDRAVLLKQVWDDPDFLAHHDKNVDKAEEHLNEKLGDYGVTIFDCLSLLKHFPTRTEWESGKLRSMLATALEKERAARHATAEPATRRSPVARAEYEKLEGELKHVNSRADSLAEENGRLRSENSKLRSELDRAHGRIDELERIISRELASA